MGTQAVDGSLGMSARNDAEGPTGPTDNVSMLSEVPSSGTDAGRVQACVQEQVAGRGDMHVDVDVGDVVMHDPTVVTAHPYVSLPSALPVPSVTVCPPDMTQPSPLMSPKISTELQTKENDHAVQERNNTKTTPNKFSTK